MEPTLADRRSVLTLGETMLRFSPPSGLRLAQADRFDVWVAGSESNVAVGLCALGHAAAWVSRLPDNALGRRIESELRALGVDDSQIIWAPADERVGTIYAEPSMPPREMRVIYDRKLSAASFLSPSDLDDSLFASHRHLHVSGITPALSKSCEAAVAKAARRAKESGMSVSFDVNYRARLWNPQAAAAALEPLIRQSDILLCCRSDASLLFGATGTPVEIALALRERFEIGIVALTCGSDGAIACDPSNAHSVPAVPVDGPMERLGSGDAFAAGFIAGYLEGLALEQAARLATAAAALKRTIPGDMLIATRADVDALLAPEKTGWR